MIKVFSSYFSRKEEPDYAKIGGDLMTKIAKWSVKPDSYTMSYSQMKVAVDKNNYLSTFPQTLDFLNLLNKETKLALNSTPMDKKTISAAKDVFEKFEIHANNYIDQKEILDGIKSKSGNSSTNTTKDAAFLKEMYSRYEKLTGNKSVAQINEEHFKGHKL